MNTVINFYSSKADWGCFSSFWFGAPFKVDGKLYKTREHYYQSKKFEGSKYESEIRNASGPMEAAKMGRDKSKPLRKDWENVKYSVMKFAIEEQCRQVPKFKELLLSSGDAKLVEHTTNDNIWGDGGDGSGQNLLGKALMEVREFFRKEEK